MKTGILIVVVLMVIGVGIYFVSNMNSPTSTNNNGGNTNTGTGDTGTIETKDVKIKSFAFNPSTITINMGDSVVWTNEDSVRHTITSDSGSELNSDLLSQGQSYSHTFNKAGTYNYYCAPHPYMKGKIIVQ